MELKIIEIDLGASNYFLTATIKLKLLLNLTSDVRRRYVDGSLRLGSQMRWLRQVLMFLRMKMFFFLWNKSLD